LEPSLLSKQRFALFETWEKAERRTTNDARTLIDVLHEVEVLCFPGCHAFHVARHPRHRRAS